MVLRKVFSIVIIANVFLLSGCGDEDVKKCLALSNDESKSLYTKIFAKLQQIKVDPQAQKLFAEILLNVLNENKLLNFYRQQLIKKMARRCIVLLNFMRAISKKNNFISTKL